MNYLSQNEKFKIQNSKVKKRPHYYRLLTIDSSSHSVRNDLTGFATAAFTACMLIVSNAINKATTVVITNTVQLMRVR